MKNWTAALFRGRNGYFEGEEKESLNQAVLKDQSMFTEHLLGAWGHVRCFMGLIAQSSQYTKALCRDPILTLLTGPLLCLLQNAGFINQPISQN